MNSNRESGIASLLRQPQVFKTLLQKLLLICNNFLCYKFKCSYRFGSCGGLGARLRKLGKRFFIFRISQPASNPLGIKSKQVCHVLDAAMTQLVRLHRCLTTTVWAWFRSSPKGALQRPAGRKAGKTGRYFVHVPWRQLEGGRFVSSAEVSLVPVSRYRPCRTST